MLVSKIAATLAVLSAIAALVGASIRSPFPQIIDWRDTLFGLGIIGAISGMIVALIAWIWS